MSRLPKLAFLAAPVLAAALSLAATARPSVPLASRPNILLITIDSLRADALGVYGYRRPTSPNLDEFARGAIVISDAIAQAPFTKPSIASLMTGLLPGSHKTFTSSKSPATILKRGGCVKGPFEVTDALPPELPTLARPLEAAGYRTVGLNTNPYLVADFGYGRGFGDYRFFHDGDRAYARAPEVFREALAAFEAHRDGPVFVWVHLIDVHNPYTPSEPYRSMFTPGPTPRLVPDREIDPTARIEGSRRWAPSSPHCAARVPGTTPPSS